MALLRGISSKAGIVVVQRPMYDVASIVSLKLIHGKRVKIWIDVDDWIFMYNLFPGGVNINFRHTVPLLALFSEGCVVASLHLEKELENYFERVEIIPTFVDSNKFVPSNETSVNSSQEIVFSWVGTLFESAVIDDIIFIADALNSLQDRRVVLEIVGDGEHRTTTEKRVSLLLDTLSVRFLGWLEPDTMPDYLKSIDVGLYCLRTKTDFTRSKSPTKLFEYMACGKPTVSSDFGEAPRFIEHGVTGFLAKEKQDFVDCCRRLAQDPELRMTMGRNARRKIEKHYNIQAGVKHLINVLLHV
jgi:glycosyltransferase involved in cell wall biosynthesis